MSQLQVSDYIKHLSSTEMARYKCKLDTVGITDPYSVPKVVFYSMRDATLDQLPDVEYPDIYNYLVHHPSAYTGLSMKTYKSTEAYKYFQSGKVKDVLIWRLENKKCFVFLAKVEHSQLLNDAPLRPWVAVQENGTVDAAHCNCMAGLGEACSHIAAVLFATSASVSLHKGQSSTSMKCAWNTPSAAAQNTGSYLPGAEIVFSNKNWRSDDAASNLPAVTPAFQQALYDGLHKAEEEEKESMQAAVLAYVPEHSDRYIPKHAVCDLPSPLSALYKAEYMKATYEDLCDHARVVRQSLHVTNTQASCIELETREQAKCKLWFAQRAGRISASKLKEAVCTNLLQPSLTLIKKICYPDSYKFSTEATRTTTDCMCTEEEEKDTNRHGTSHESDALAAYRRVSEASHANVCMGACGLVINPLYPHLGASPDAIVECTCCGRGVVEVKCPFNLKVLTFEEMGKDFCLRKNEEGAFQLDKRHQFYFQIQTQMYIVDLEYADFVVWPDNGIDALFVERVQKDTDFFHRIVSRATTFFSTAVLPKLLGRYLQSLVKKAAAQRTMEAAAAQRSSGVTVRGWKGRGGC